MNENRQKYIAPAWLAHSKARFMIRTRYRLTGQIPVVPSYKSVSAHTRLKAAPHNCVHIFKRFLFSLSYVLSSSQLSSVLNNWITTPWKLQSCKIITTRLKTWKRLIRCEQWRSAVTLWNIIFFPIHRAQCAWLWR